jgi:phage FluMu protein Com
MAEYYTERNCPYCHTTCNVSLDHIQTDSPCPHCEGTKFIDLPSGLIQKKFILQVSNMQITRWARMVCCVQCKTCLDDVSFESSLAIECFNCHEIFRTGPRESLRGKSS